MFWGANGAGKTNILEAISLLSPGRGIRRARSDDLTRRPEHFGWKVFAELQKSTTMCEIELVGEPAVPRQTKIDGKAAPQTALAQIMRILWLVPTMDRLWVEGAEGRRRFLDRMTLSFLPDHAQVSLIYEKAMRDRNHLLKEGRRDPHWFGAIEAQMAQSGARIAANRRSVLIWLQEAQDSVQTMFPSADLALKSPENDPEPETAKDIETLLADMRPRDMAAGRTLKGPHRIDLEALYAAKGVPANQCSTGEQKALLISLILANARALQRRIGRPPLLLLDEVAAHLDEGRRNALYDEICALGAQAFLTGTDADLFTGLASRAVGYHVQEADGMSQLKEVDL